MYERGLLQCYLPEFTLVKQGILTIRHAEPSVTRWMLNHCQHHMLSQRLVWHPADSVKTRKKLTRISYKDQIQFHRLYIRHAVDQFLWNYDASKVRWRRNSYGAHVTIIESTAGHDRMQPAAVQCEGSATPGSQQPGAAAHPRVAFSLNSGTQA